MRRGTTISDRDLLGRRWAMWLFWIAPWVLIAISGGAGNFIRTLTWSAGFALMGIVCLINARNCARLHCFFTGPLFLLAALASLLYGVHVLPLGPHGWNWIIGITAAGSLLACCGLEPLFGKYTAGSSSSTD